MRALGQPAFIQQLREADLIVAFDEATGREFVVFGKELLRTVVRSQTTMDVGVWGASINVASLELEALLAATVAAKGRHEYEEGGWIN